MRMTSKQLLIRQKFAQRARYALARGDRARAAYWQGRVNLIDRYFGPRNI
jgi:hypothetical protein